MHEFSIIQNIINIVLDTAKQNNIEEIRIVEIEVGQASGVIRHALEFAWESAIQDTILINSVLKINEIPLLLKCRACNNEYNSSDIFDVCPLCGEINSEIV